MKVEILHVPGCPSVPLLESRLADALAGRPGFEVTRREIADGAAAAAAGMAGSPTLLVDGVDPFGDAPDACGGSFSCRLYPDAQGRLDGAPSAEALRAALGLDHRP